MVERPDPDQLLVHVQAEEARAKRGHLHIFFGASAGVGKTYAMLEAARSVKASGTDVVLGYVEPHGRVETERLTEGMERLPTRMVRYRDIARAEFDLDAALARHPAILLVDELAHSNLVGGDPAPRHPKRWQDVEELLEAGIDVWTTVNVQHLESLNDLIVQTTGVQQRETLPDHVFDKADEVELIDLPPDDLLARLRAGKIYVQADAANAVERFFRKPNLMALREIALRRVADRVEAAARDSALTDRMPRSRLACDRVLVATGPDPQSEQLIRVGKRLADALDADWTVVYVETPALLKLSEVQRNRRIELMRLAESLGAETVTLDGPTAVEALLEYAATRHVTRVIVGSPKRHGWKALVRPSTATELARRARSFDVITVAATATQTIEVSRRTSRTGQLATPVRWSRYGWAVALSIACTLAAFAMYSHLDTVNLVMVYLLGVTIAGLRLGRGPSVLTSVLSVGSFDFFFVPPRFNFVVNDAQYLITFGVMLLISLVIATLMASVRQQTRVSGARERRTALLYAMSRELAATRGTANMCRIAVRHVAEVFRSKVVVLLPDAGGRLHFPADRPGETALRGADLAVAQWVTDHGRQAGLGTDTLSAAPALYVPLGDARRHLGVLSVLPENARRVLLPEQSHLLETFAGQIGLALERALLAERAEAARVTAEGESLRNTLLASISHDLRTPLAVMAGAGSTLAEHGASLDEAVRLTLARSIETKAREMSELVSNVLDLMRFESGQIKLRNDWQTLDELLEPSLRALEEPLTRYSVELRLPTDLPPVYVDAGLITQVFTNLLDNIVKYPPPGTHIAITAITDNGGAGHSGGSRVRVTVDDDGPGLPIADPDLLFEKFQRGAGEGTIVGVGLGLAICRAIVRAHGGEIEGHTRTTGGTRIELTLPAEEPA